MTNIGRSSPEAPDVVIYGWGNMGPVVSELLVPPGSNISIYDPDPKGPIPKKARRLEAPDQVLDAQYYFMAIPFPYDSELMDVVEKGIDPEAALVDMSSVQLVTTEEHRRRGTLERPNFTPIHFLFGPNLLQRKGRGIEKQGVVVIEEPDMPKRGRLSRNLIEQYKDAGADVYPATADTHDFKMARHAAATFVGRALYNAINRNLSERELYETRHLRSSFQTSSTRAMQEFINSTDNSPSVLRVIQTYNPYAPFIRAKIVREILTASADVDREETMLLDTDEEALLATLREEVSDLTAVVALGAFCRIMATDQIGRVKAQGEEPMFDKAREDQVLFEVQERLKALGSPPELVEIEVEHIERLMRLAVNRNKGLGIVFSPEFTEKPLDGDIDPRTSVMA